MLRPKSLSSRAMLCATQCFARHSALRKMCCKDSTIDKEVYSGICAIILKSRKFSIVIILKSCKFATVLILKRCIFVYEA